MLDGAVLAAGAVGSRQVIVKVGADCAPTRWPRSRVRSAVRDRDPVSFELVAAPEGYVAGEESAVVHYLNGGAQLPTFVPPRPYERGYRGRPTLIQNPETLAQLALVARFGSRWYRELGTVADPGSALVTISGAVRAPGRLRARVRDVDERPAGGRRRSVPAAPGAARRRLLRHVGRGLAGDRAAARPRGPALGRRARSARVC